MPHDAFSFELLLALSRTPQTAETIRRKLSERGVRAPLRSIQTKLERLAEYPRYPIVIDRSSAPFTYAWRERAPVVTVPGEDEAQRLLSALSRAFAANRKIDVQFSDFRILRHPTLDGIYGVRLRQRYTSDRYSDDGWLFLLWDFRNEAIPLIHVRTWQPATDVHDTDDVISIGDFNLK